MTPLWVSHKTFGLYNKSFGIWKGVGTTLAKPKRKAIPRSFCNNIINCETKRIFLKILISCSLYQIGYIDSNK
jgi:hypothetical protein